MERNNVTVSLYFQSWLIKRKRDRKATFARIKVAICNLSNHILFDLKKPMAKIELNKLFVWLKALILEINAATS